MSWCVVSYLIFLYLQANVLLHQMVHHYPPAAHRTYRNLVFNDRMTNEWAIWQKMNDERSRRGVKLHARPKVIYMYGTCYLFPFRIEFIYISRRIGNDLARFHTRTTHAPRIIIKNHDSHAGERTELYRYNGILCFALKYIFNELNKICPNICMRNGGSIQWWKLIIDWSKKEMHQKLSHDKMVPLSRTPKNRWLPNGERKNFRSITSCSYTFFMFWKDRMQE